MDGRALAPPSRGEEGEAPAEIFAFSGLFLGEGGLRDASLKGRASVISTVFYLEGGGRKETCNFHLRKYGNVRYLSDILKYLYSVFVIGFTTFNPQLIAKRNTQTIFFEHKAVYLLLSIGYITANGLLFKCDSL